VNLSKMPPTANVHRLREELRVALEEGRGIRAIPELETAAPRPLRRRPVSSYILLVVVLIGTIAFVLSVWRR
jgi:hypothetical protein